MSFETVLGNTEFEFVVSNVTLTAATRHSTSEEHGVLLDSTSVGEW
jgi:hypothetical protein